MSLASWKDMVEEIASSQSSSEAAQIDLLSISESEEAAAKSAFWVSVLKSHTEGAGFAQPGRRQTPVRLLSACTGSFAEAAALEELGWGTGYLISKESSDKCFKLRAIEVVVSHSQFLECMPSHMSRSALRIQDSFLVFTRICVDSFSG